MHINLPEKRYYAIGEVAKAFGVNTSLIRFWEKEFDVLRPRKSSGGKRKFTREDVKNLHLIYNLVKERGYTLEGAKAQIGKKRQEELSNITIIHKLENIKAMLLKIKAQL
ncbi:MAG: MerR family transcriptional regulator [Sinomicrobium sp.]|nr:MerR family transcriptional regulator [Sinomicrobium sp.]